MNNEMKGFQPIVFDLSKEILNLWMKYTGETREHRFMIGKTPAGTIINMLQICINDLRSIESHLREETKVERLLRDLTEEEIKELESILAKRYPVL